MTERVSDGAAMIAGMSPVLMAGTFAFVSFESEVPAAMLAAAIGTFREAEGMTLIVPSALAPDSVEMRQITLNVWSSLEGVGLTAAVSQALADADIACNVVAAFHHDHIFVPEACADRALRVLKERAAREG